MAKQSRRNFLKLTSSGALGIGLLACSAPMATPPDAEPMMGMAMGGEPVVEPPRASTIAAPSAPSAPAPSSNGPRLLIVVQLSGGDDGLNAVVPYGDGLYYQLRPQLAIQGDQVLPLNDRVGLHPSLKSFKALWDQDKLAVIQGVGYPDPSRSHFRSMDIWHTGRLENNVDNGWLGNFMAQAQRADQGPFQCVALGNSVPRALQHEHISPAALQDTATFTFQTDRRLPGMRDSLIQAFSDLQASANRAFPTAQLVANNWLATAQGVDQLRAVGESYRPFGQYGNSPFGRALQQTAVLAAAELGTRVLYVSIGGFDTHANQRNTHAGLLTQLSDGLAALQKDLEHSGQADRTLILAFSEFGRRVRENGSGGTDHGAAGPMFIIGNRARGGLYGEYPDLTNLDEGDLKHSTDFRQVYATVIEDWLGASAHSVLGGSFDRLGFVA
ncbi:MAG: DUF1501 domain-containing protein [Chloroflexota bacterium]